MRLDADFNLITEENLEISEAYARLFNTPDGQLVLQNLNSIFMEQSTQFEHQCGRLSVVQQVNSHIQRGTG